MWASLIEINKYSQYSKKVSPLVFRRCPAGLGAQPPVFRRSCMGWRGGRCCLSQVVAIQIEEICDEVA